MKELSGKTAVITGAASGIGLGLTKAFAGKGMKLVLADLDEEALGREADALRNAGHEVLTKVTDVADAAQMDALGDAVMERFGAVHLVCNNAGVGGGGKLWELSTEDWEFVLGPNLWGVIHGVRVFTKHMIAQNEGHIVNTASMAGLISVPGVGPYNVSKHGVVTLSETLLGELRTAKANVGVSVLCPGFVKTRIFEPERHRPSDWKPTEGDANMQGVRDALYEGAMDVQPVVDAVVQAVEEQQFYILTHGQMRPLIERRLQGILAGDLPAGGDMGNFFGS